MRSTPAGRLLIGVAAAAAVVAPAAPQLTASAAAQPTASAVRYAATLAPGRRAAPPPRLPVFRVLQMNLCDSGFARCYAGGRSVLEAAAVIRAQRPDAVTLNEICNADSDRALFRAMQQTWPGDWVFTAFHPAWDRRRNAPYLCRNGQQYGVAVIGHAAPASWAGGQARGGIYPVQGAKSVEQRAWVCAYAIGHYDVCTTHLAANAGGVALAQCRYLMGTAVPRARTAMGGYSPTVVGGDLNLTYGGRPDAQDCVPPGWFRKGDDDLQHVLATSDYTFLSARWIGMRNTDHPAWLVVLRIP
jgi:hypothetical protein